MNASTLTPKIPVEIIINNDIKLEGELQSILSPRTIDRIVPKLPIASRLHLWKRELYFEIGIRMGSEKSVSTCNAGAIAYWPQGDAVCLFFEEMTPFNKVNP
ncbi:MAG: cyclophilin-like family protein, partial [Promethearchaeota archaeon]